jgi:hypothetical protein
MAISTMAPRSSITASPSKKIRRPGASRLRTKANTPSAKAMSVAVGIAAPSSKVASAPVTKENPSRREHAADRAGDRQRGAA